jgi:hypothetical protein
MNEDQLVTGNSFSAGASDSMKANMKSMTENALDVSPDERKHAARHISCNSSLTPQKNNNNKQLL